MDANIEVEKSKRGVFLWIMLAIYIFLSLQRLIGLLFPIIFSEIYAGGPSWGYEYNLFMFAVVTIGIIGIIAWRKWGIYLIAAVDLTAILIDQIYFTPRPSIWLVISSLALLGFLIWAVKRKWSYFRR